VSDDTRVLVVGLDAADFSVVQQLIAARRLPHLDALARNGVSGRLESPADLFAGGVWPTFYTGRPVASHGVFHNKQWRPNRMRIETPAPAWTSAVPFWESWDDAGIESLIIDVPMVLGRPRPFRGVYLGGWGTHDLMCRGSWPAGLWREVEHRFGAPVMPREQYGRQSDASLSALDATMRRATLQLRDLAVDALSRHRWRFACVVFGALHRAGHYLWDRSQVEPGTRSRDAPDVVPDALADLYSSLDEAVGRLVAHAPARTVVVACAVHGMGPNPGWSDLLPDVLLRLEEHRSGRVPRRGALYRLKQSLPHHWLRPLLDALPAEVNDSLLQLWSRRMFDWRRTRYFPMPMDQAGYLRINLRGRERQGVVGAGDEYESVCREVADLVTSLRDEATGAAIAGRPVWAWRDADPAAACRELLPDLIVPWTGPTAASTRVLTSALLPGFRFVVPDHLPSGRSGNHRGPGWFIAAGPGIAAGVRAPDHDVLDLLPTIRHRLGLAPDPQLPGRVIRDLAGA